jgi:hypothetical protein
MDAKTVHKLSSRVPTMTRKLDLSKFESARGSRFRNQLVWFSLIPMVFLMDLNGGLAKFGFVKTTFDEEYKVRPDYTTQTLFTLQRTDVPEFKHF